MKAVDQKDLFQITDLSCTLGLVVTIQKDIELNLDMTVALTFTEETDKDHMVMPGDNCELVCELIHPIAIEKGMRFTIRNSQFIDYTHDSR